MWASESFKSKGSPLVTMTQAIRASLLASATAALLYPRRTIMVCTHSVSGGQFFWSRAMAARTPWISKVRRFPSPFLVVLLSLISPPVSN
jgi:hypothetical protein